MSASRYGGGPSESLNRLIPIMQELAREILESRLRKQDGDGEDITHV